MRMRTSDKARIYERIEALDCELRTCEAHHRCAARDVLRLRSTQEGERIECRDLHAFTEGTRKDLGNKQEAVGYVAKFSGRSMDFDYSIWPLCGALELPYPKHTSYSLIGVEIRGIGHRGRSSSKRVA